MNIDMILPKYRDELAGAIEALRAKLLAGELGVGQFLAARERIYGSYLCASVATAAGVNVVMHDPLTCRAEVSKSNLA
jgi:hypothetical protein